MTFVNTITFVLRQYFQHTEQTFFNILSNQKSKGMLTFRIKSQTYCKVEIAESLR